jgi:hypothetical protein
VKNKKWILLILVLLLVPAIACGSSNPLEGVPNEGNSGPAGFWSGLWDGFTATIAFFLNLFGVADYNIYEVNNNGGWYNLGFLIGIGAFAGGGSSAASSSRK